MKADLYDSQEDQDYQPMKKQERQFQIDQITQGSKKRKAPRQWVNIKEAWQETKRQAKEQPSQPVKKLSYQEIVDMSTRILSISEIRRQKKVIFAGKEFILDQISGEMKEVEKVAVQPSSEPKPSLQPQTNQRDQLTKEYGYLNHVIYNLQQRYRNINSMHKTKMDWKNYIKKQGIEDKLKFNRKGGALEDARFMKRANQSA